MAPAACAQPAKGRFRIYGIGFRGLGLGSLEHLKET